MYVIRTYTCMYVHKHVYIPIYYKLTWLSEAVILNKHTKTLSRTTISKTLQICCTSGLCRLCIIYKSFFTNLINLNVMRIVRYFYYELEQDKKLL